MSVPTFDQFIAPLLRVLADHPEGISAGEAYEEVADQVGLTEEDREKLLPSGTQQTYKNRIGWAHDRLKRAGYSHSPRWGIWQLTSKGNELLNRQAGDLSDELVEQIARPRREALLDGLAQDNGDAPVGESAATPEERIESAQTELHESVAQELLNSIGTQTPLFFEKLVLDLMRAMGYGAGRNSIKHSGGSHDGGIDGVISLDKLGLEKIYVQAKRWSNTVGRPELQAFSGALSGRHASKGVFITTSDFSAPARDFADRVSYNIVLIDGKKLATLMIEHGVGVQLRRKVSLVELDRDYFDDE